MLRVTEINNSDKCVTLYLEGRIIGQWVDDLLNRCEAYIADRHNIILDLSGVCFVDDRGIKTLKAFDGNRVGLTGCSMFLSALLELNSPSDGNS